MSAAKRELSAAGPESNTLTLAAIVSILATAIAGLGALIAN
jgi:hypothetical protein